MRGIVYSLVFMTCVTILVALAFFVANASASRYHMNWGQAMHESDRLARGTCEELPECTAYSSGPCQRESPSRFQCLIGLFYPGVYVDEEIECDQRLYWGVNWRGYIVLRNFSNVRCYAL